MGLSMYSTGPCDIMNGYMEYWLIRLMGTLRFTHPTDNLAIPLRP